VIYCDDDDESVEKIAYFVPKAWKPEPERKSSTQEDFVLARNYISRDSFKKSLSSLDTFVFIEKDEKITYCNIDKKISLTRSVNLDASTRKQTRLSVKYRPFSEPELNLQNHREETLEVKCTDMGGISDSDNAV